MSKLGLGTAQFGLDYGIANPSGRVPEEEVARILDLGRRAGISVLDTAPAYGVAEATLGRLLRPDDRFRIITKTPACPMPTLTPADITAVRAGFEGSLRALGTDRVEGLLVHRADDLLKPGAKRLLAMLEEWKASGRVRKLGVSVYEKRQIEALFARYHFDIVQLPVNLFDQRLVKEGVLRTLSEAGVEVHARSIFLQGLILMDMDELPAFAAPWRQKIEAFHADLTREGITALEAALAFVRELPEVHVALIGVLSTGQLDACLKAEKVRVGLDWAAYAIDDPCLVDPRGWPRS